MRRERSARRTMEQVMLSACVCAGLVGVSTTGWALAPQTNALVTQVSFTGELDSYKVDDEATAYLGLAECEKAALGDPLVTARFTTASDLTLTDANGSALLQPAYAFNATDVADRSPTCTDAAALCAEIPSGDVTATSTIVDISIGFEELTGISVAAACANLEEEYFVRLTFNSNTVTPTIQKTDARIVIDAVAPEPPQSFTATATDTQIQITWEDSSSTDVSAYQVVYSSTSFAGGVRPDELDVQFSRANASDNSTNTNTVTASSLVAGETIYVALAAVDESGNVSALLDPQAVVVVETVDFWDAYKEGGGAEAGGYCASAPAGAPTRPSRPWGVIALLGGVVWASRRRGQA